MRSTSHLTSIYGLHYLLSGVVLYNAVVRNCERFYFIHSFFFWNTIPCRTITTASSYHPIITDSRNISYLAQFRHNNVLCESSFSIMVEVLGESLSHSPSTSLSGREKDHYPSQVVVAFVSASNSFTFTQRMTKPFLLYSFFLN